MASDDAYVVDGIDVTTNCLYDNNAITEKKLDDWKEEVKQLIAWHRSPEHHRQWPVGCTPKDARSMFRMTAHRYEFDSTTNTLFKRETRDGESKALIIYIIIKINEIIV